MITFAPPIVKLPVTKPSITVIVLEDIVLAPEIVPPPTPVVPINAAVILLVTVKLFDTNKLPAVTILVVFCNAVLATVAVVLALLYALCANTFAELALSKAACT